MRKWIRQLLCTHTLGKPTIVKREETSVYMVTLPQNQGMAFENTVWSVKTETRICTKCKKKITLTRRTKK